MNPQSWPAPGKINLFLHVVGRRADGYHLLQTAFQFLDFGDLLDIEPRRDARIVRHADYGHISPREDLVVRAAEALRAAAGERRGAEIRVNKRLPMGGGLGGGSSDAATTLLALNRLWGLDLDVERLAAIGLALGADVPVFVRGVAAWAEGVGEILTPLAPPEDWLLVVWPGVAVATAEVFKHPDLTRNTPTITIRAFLAGAGRNSCEAVVRKLHPEVAAALDWLGQRGDARMTGTGSCVFLRCPSESVAEAHLAELPERWRGFVTRGRNRSPLLDRLERN